MQQCSNAAWGSGEAVVAIKSKDSENAGMLDLNLLLSMDCPDLTTGARHKTFLRTTPLGMRLSKLFQKGIILSLTVHSNGPILITHWALTRPTVSALSVFYVAV